MINYKLDHNLTGGEHWPALTTVFVEGVEDATLLPNKKIKKEEKEKIIQSWENVAVLRATSNQPTQFYIGFYNQNAISYLKHEFSTNLDFGMRRGPDDVNFFVFPKDLTTPIKLELVILTTEDDPKYTELIVL